jgi:EmrB/QacA subfamily drug resistance transporter
MQMVRIPPHIRLVYLAAKPNGQGNRTEASMNATPITPVAPVTRVRLINPALVALSLSMLLASFGTSVANVSLPTLAKVFEASFQQVQWVVLAYLLSITTLIVSVGRLGDIIGRRRLMVAGLALFTFGSLLCGLSPTLWLVIAARAVQGLGAAVMMALSIAFVGQTVANDMTGRAIGLLGTMSAIGTALGPSLGGFLIAGFGWQAIFLVSVPFGLATLCLAYRALPTDPARPTHRPGLDLIGTALLALTLAAYALAMTLGRGQFGLLNAVLLLSALAGLAAFTLAETKVAAPLIRLSIFRQPTLSTGLATSLLVSTVVMATLVVGPFYLTGALGLGATAVGAILSVGPVVSALVGVPAGRLTDRFGTKAIATVGLAAMTAGALALSLTPAAFGIPGYVVPLALLTAGYSAFQTANNTSVMKDLKPDQRGVISGMLNLSRNLGLVTGVSVMGAVFAFGTGVSDIAAAAPAAVTAGTHLAFTLATVVIATALTLVLRSKTEAPAS